MDQGYMLMVFTYVALQPYTGTHFSYKTSVAAFCSHSHDSIIHDNNTWTFQPELYGYYAL